jgi:uncharacterized protein
MRQVAALPYRCVTGSEVDVEVLLVTSSAGRWIIPKGDIDEGMPSYQAAEKEAFEEGGVRGQMGDRPLGTFQTCKQRDGASIRADVDVFPLKVVEELDRWPEMGVRQRRWLPIEQAAEAVREPELAAIIRAFSD